jgi:succinate dehydrogenase/fumarate reductase flavoprotein subunit
MISPKKKEIITWKDATRASATWHPEILLRGQQRSASMPAIGVGRLKNAVYLDFKHAIESLGLKTIEDRYGNLFKMYKKITGVDAYQEPMQISPAAHFSMGGLWVDYELMTTIPGLYAVGECNFSDHGANRWGPIPCCRPA